MTFRVGDRVVHPSYGAGVVTWIRELGVLGNEKKRYYAIQLLSQPETTVTVAVRNAEQVGLRSPIPRSKLNQVWRVLRADPNALPSDHNQRYALIEDKLHSDSVLQIAEVLRDLAWRQKEKRHLTIRGKRLYERGMEFLASEVAGAQDSDFETAEAQISEYLTASITGIA